MNNSQLIFRHQSPLHLKELRPLTYEELKISRSVDMSEQGLEEYLSDRIKQENIYRQQIPEYQNNKSFLYATIVDYHKMEHPLSYPGFTYYFNLSDQELEQCIFHIVADKHEYEPIKGLVGLEKCLSEWSMNSNNFQSLSDNLLGTIDPRIEVAIPFKVNFFGFIPEECR